MVKAKQLTEGTQVEAELVSQEPVSVMASMPRMNLEALIDKALAANVNIEIIERLEAMFERQRAQWARQQFTAALGKFKSECPPIVKYKPVFNKGASAQEINAFWDSGDLRGVKYLYAPLEDIQAIADPHLATNGFSYTFKNEVNAEKKELTSICHLSHVDGHTELTPFTVPIGSDYMSKQQEFGSARSFAKRYAFLDATGLQPTGEDNDGAETEGDRKPRGGKDHRFKTPQSKSEQRGQRVEKGEQASDPTLAQKAYPNIKRASSDNDMIQKSSLATIRSNMKRFKISEEKFAQSFGFSLEQLDKHCLNDMLDWMKENSQ